METHSSEVIHWLHISGRKSLALSRVFQEGPFLILFTPDNPYHSSNDLFHFTRSVASEYLHCHQSDKQVGPFESKTAAELRESDRICRDYIKNRVTRPANSISEFQQIQG